MYKGYVTDIEGVRVGHAQYEDGVSGCTVLLFDEKITCGADIRGGAPGTRETDLFNASMGDDSPNALVLSGGSFFGLDTQVGVVKYLEEQNIGMDTGFGVMPLVSGAIIFDLLIGDINVRSNRELGYEAAKNASKDENRQGNVGAGIGGSIGKVSIDTVPMKGGLGSATLQVGDLKVSAIVAVNAVGDVYDYESGDLIASGFLAENNKMISSYDVLKEAQIAQDNVDKSTGKNTTIGIIVTNAKLGKVEANKMAEMAHNGYAKVIMPIHTDMDGDTIFCAATNKVDAHMALVGSMAAEVMAKAIINAVKSADTLAGSKSYKEMHNK